MYQLDNTVKIEEYIPLTYADNVVEKHPLARIGIAKLCSPNVICGMARRIGYTGSKEDGRAIYRLKVTVVGFSKRITLPVLFVLDQGKFIEYERWQHDHQ